MVYYLYHRGCWLVLIIFYFSLMSTLFSPIATAQHDPESTRQSSNQLPDEDWIIDNNTQRNDQTINLDRDIIILPNGSLTLVNVTLLLNRTNYQDSYFRVEAGGKLSMSHCTIQQTGQDESHTGIEIFSDEIEISNCNISGNFNGLEFHSVSDAAISNTTFYRNRIAAFVNNSENISFTGCTFIGNSEYALSINNSGALEEIEITNCTVSPQDRNGTQVEFQLINSEVKVINMIYPNPINGLFELDNRSNLTIYHYLHILTTNEKNKKLSNVKISIQDRYGTWAFNSSSDDSGHVYWIPLPVERLIGKKNITNFNPYTIYSSKKDYKDKTKELILRFTNSTPFQIKLNKKESGDDFDFQSTLFLACTCFLIVIVVFVILMAVNVRIMRNRTKSAGLLDIEPSGNKTKESIFDFKDMITCSECGAQITKNVAFCPHCGEYFEGEELTCPGCNAVVSDDDKSCPNCGKIFETDKTGKTAKPEELKTVKKEEKSKITKAGLDPGTEVPPKTEPVEDHAKLFCSECGGVISQSEDRCPGCGLPFGDSGSNDTQGLGKHKRYRKKAKTGKKGYRYGRPLNEDNQENAKAKTAKKITAAEEKEAERIKEIERKRTNQLKDLNEVYMCSMCGAEIYGDSIKCPKCGTEFD